MKINRYIATIAIGIVSLTTKAQDIQSFADSLMLKNGIPEIGFAVIAPDRILELQTLGFHRTDLQNEQTKANLSDYFHLGSNTKAITGFVAAHLVENHKITWTTKFFDLFPDWKSQSNPTYYEITLADLLSHRARIQPYTSGLEYQKLPGFKGNKSDQRQQFAKYLLTTEPVQSEGRIYNYSNAGYSIAALMLEKVSGKSWEELTREIMTTKVNVAIEFGWPNTHGENQPYGHWVENDTLKALPPDLEYNLALGEPAGDISMTLPDYAQFIQLNLQGLLGIDTILKASTYDYLHYGLKGYAIGWSNVADTDNQLSEHSGSAGTFFCYTLINKKEKIAFIVVANSATKETVQGIFKLLDRLKREYGRKGK
jgi:D-alanyl-D-alanine carboxypeptidase